MNRYTAAGLIHDAMDGKTERGRLHADLGNVLALGGEVITA